MRICGCLLLGSEIVLDRLQSLGRDPDREWGHMFALRRGMAFSLPVWK